MKILHLSLLLVLGGISSNSYAAEPQNEQPHAAAIRLVMKARDADVRKLDQSSEWWDDSRERTWSAKRPFPPGIIDSRTYFQVSYSIDGRVVATWTVDTRSGQVGAEGESIRIGR